MVQRPQRSLLDQAQILHRVVQVGPRLQPRLERVERVARLAQLRAQPDRRRQALLRLVELSQRLGRLAQSEVRLGMRLVVAQHGLALAPRRSVALQLHQACRAVEAALVQRLLPRLAACGVVDLLQQRHRVDVLLARLGVGLRLEERVARLARGLGFVHGGCGVLVLKRQRRGVDHQLLAVLWGGTDSHNFREKKVKTPQRCAHDQTRTGLTWTSAVLGRLKPGFRPFSTSLSYTGQRRDLPSRFALRGSGLTGLERTDGRRRFWIRGAYNYISVCVKPCI
eukprot:scaffold127188_cov64-Phaeocystis_antarctica.AAC.2